MTHRAFFRRIPATAILSAPLLPALLLSSFLCPSLLLSTGCRPQPSRPMPRGPVPEIELTGPPPPLPGPTAADLGGATNLTGVFHGQWTTGSRVYFDIIHHVGQVPVISVFPQRHGVVEVTETRLEGYTLSFNQYVHPSPGEDTPPLPPTATNIQWRVTLRIAINNPNNMLLEMDRVGGTNRVSRLLRRVYKAEETEEPEKIEETDKPGDEARLAPGSHPSHTNAGGARASTPAKHRVE